MQALYFCAQITGVIIGGDTMVTFILFVLILAFVLALAIGVLYMCYHAFAIAMGCAVLYFIIDSIIRGDWND